ncbi:MAG: uroporphyrinogen decarboxylase family protein [Phycisphaerae bacterium]|nr:uroporphyrinogen decarboxylase family protein [Phycisphaerae bacterium]
MGRKLFMNAVARNNSSGQTVFGTGTSIACQDLMEEVGVFFPDAHLDPEKMTALAICGCTILGFDVVMPLFSVCHEAAAMGCNVDWGGVDLMPESGKCIFEDPNDIKIPNDFLKRPGCSVPLKAISLLRKRLGDDAAVCGKVFGGWTQSYHYFGLENFLITTIEDPDKTRRILQRLIPVTVQFANAQIDAGADCVLLGDHATRDLCSPKAYDDFVKPLHSRLAEEINAPVILHICGDTSDRIGMIAQTHLDCFHWDTKTGTHREVRKLAGDRLSLMGGISNFRLLRSTPEQIADDAAAAAGSDMDIIGPECAIPLTTPLANLKAVASIGRRARQ